MGHSVESTVSGVKSLVSDSGPLRICHVILWKSLLPQVCFFIYNLRGLHWILFGLGAML